MTVTQLRHILEALPAEYCDAEVAVGMSGDLETANVVVIDPPSLEDGETAGCVWICSKLYTVSGGRLLSESSVQPRDPQ